MPSESFDERFDRLFGNRPPDSFKTPVARIGEVMYGEKQLTGGDALDYCRTLGERRPTLKKYGLIYYFVRAWVQKGQIWAEYALEKPDDD